MVKWRNIGQISVENQRKLSIYLDEIMETSLGWD